VYGTRCAGVIALAVERPALAERLAPGCPVIKAEIVHAAREEMAVSLADAVLRRTALAHTAAPGREIVGAAATLMAAELGWTAARVEAEHAALRAALAVP
jgi:glycerol-3-phosphate dehydrogenase